MHYRFTARKFKTTPLFFVCRHRHRELQRFTSRGRQSNKDTRILYVFRLILSHFRRPPPPLQERRVTSIGTRFSSTATRTNGDDSTYRRAYGESFKSSEPATVSYRSPRTVVHSVVIRRHSESTWSYIIVTAPLKYRSTIKHTPRTEFAAERVNFLSNKMFVGHNIPFYNTSVFSAVFMDDHGFVFLFRLDVL